MFGLNCTLAVVFTVLSICALLVKIDANLATTSTNSNDILNKINNHSKEEAIKFKKYSQVATNMDEFGIYRFTKNFKSPKEDNKLARKITYLHPQLPAKLIDILTSPQELKKADNLYKQPQIIVKGQPSNKLLNKDNEQGNPSVGINLLQERAYYPNRDLSKVCYDRSTIYNKPRVRSYLRRVMYSYYGPDEIPMWFGLRWEIYIKGNSEECHNVELDTWKSFLECNLRRNQRIEYMIPMYPLHQIGYYYRKPVIINENAFTAN